MKKILLLFFLTVQITLCQAQNISIIGTVNDSITGEALIGANIVNIVKGNGYASDFDGHFRLVTAKPDVQLKISYVGYEPKNITFTVNKDTALLIKLNPYKLNEAVIKGELPMHEQTLMGFNTLSAEKLKAIPSFIGEPDIMKAITFLPGIQNGKEGSSNLHVRGGDRDQNLILLDGTPIYNTNHVSGFLSIFNADAIKKVDIYKGGFPAQYGGRLSSILDVKLREGNKKKQQGKFNFGTLITSLTLEGPIKNEKTSYLLAARISYLDLFFLRTRLETKRNGYGDINSYTIGDLNFKVNHELKDKSILSFHTYLGGDYNSSQSTDKIGNRSHTGKKLSNVSIGLNYNKIFNTKYFFNVGLNYSNYNSNFFSNFSASQSNNTGNSQTTSNFYSKTLFSNLTLKSKLEFNLSHSNQIKVGINIDKLNYDFNINRTSSSFYPDKNIRVSDTFNLLSGKQQPLEVAIFVEDEISMAKNVRLNIGLRSTYYQFKDAKYPFLEPRLSLRYLLNENTSFKINAMRLQQTNHQLIQKNSGFERETWVGATSKILPQRGTQYSAGYFQTLKKYNIEYGIEVYYKKTTNLIEYQQSLKFEAEYNNWEKSVLTGGKGKSYGIEFFAQRNESKWNCMLSYTLSWSNRQFEQLNNAKAYPSLYDRRHVLNALFMYQIGNNWTASAQWVFNSGSAFTLPVGKASVNPYFYEYLLYDKKNNARLPNYHRLDVSVKKEWQTSRGKNRYFTFNIYNVYNRQNATFLYIDKDKLKQISEFPFLPSLSIGAKF